MSASPAIREVMFFENGNYCAFDRKGEQIPEEQGCAWFKILQDKLDRGVIDGGTKVLMAGWDQKDYRVRDLIERGSLRAPSNREV